MNTIDYIIIAAVLGILALCAWFIYRSKKKGKKCIGCPDSCACASGNCTGCCSGQCNKM